jgi:hypothetical protein
MEIMESIAVDAILLALAGTGLIIGYIRNRNPHD